MVHEVLLVMMLAGGGEITERIPLDQCRRIEAMQAHMRLTGGRVTATDITTGKKRVVEHLVCRSKAEVPVS